MSGPCEKLLKLAGKGQTNRKQGRERVFHREAYKSRSYVKRRATSPVIRDTQGEATLMCFSAVSRSGRWRGWNSQTCLEEI